MLFDQLIKMKTFKDCESNVILLFVNVPISWYQNEIKLIFLMRRRLKKLSKSRAKQKSLDISSSKLMMVYTASQGRYFIPLVHRHMCTCDLKGQNTLVGFEGPLNSNISFKPVSLYNYVD